MITVTKGIWEKRMQEYVRQVEETGEEIVVTKDQIPVLKIVSLKKISDVNNVFADVRGKIRYHEDILNPETDEWGEL